MFSGEIEEAISELEMAIRLSPRDPSNALWYPTMSVVHFLAGHYEKSIRWCKKSLQDLPNALPGVHRPMAAAYAMLDQMDEPRSAIDSLKSRVPNVSIEATKQQMPFRRDTDIAHYLNALRKAGLGGDRRYAWLCQTAWNRARYFSTIDIRYADQKNLSIIPLLFGFSVRHRFLFPSHGFFVRWCVIDTGL